MTTNNAQEENIIISIIGNKNLLLTGKSDIVNAFSDYFTNADKNLCDQNSRG